MADGLPILPYGREPKPGGITFVDQPNGAVDIHILPRPTWQLWLIGALLASPFILLFGYIWAFGQIKTPGVAAPRWFFAFVLPLLGLIGPICVFTYLIRGLGRQSCFIQASREGLRIFYTEHGDPCRFEAAADQVLNVRYVAKLGGGYNLPGLAVDLKTRVYTMPLFRRKKDLLAIAAAMRRGLGLNTEVSTSSRS